MLFLECQSIEATICFISAIAAIASVFVAHRSSKRQMQISLFAEFTRRYQEIMLHIRQNGDDKEYYQILYIDLCSEEFFMHNAGYLPKKVWKIWKEGMTHEIKDSYLNLWRQDKENYDSDFQVFFDEIVSKNAKQNEANKKTATK